MYADPLAVIMAIWDAEIAEGNDDPAPSTLDAVNWEQAIADFAKAERIQTQPFKCANLHSARSDEYTRERNLLRCKSWRDFGRHWPHCFQQLTCDPGLWLPLGRQYKPLGQEQFDGGFYRYDDFASIAWRFTCDPLTIEGVWCDATCVKDEEDDRLRRG